MPDIIDKIEHRDDSDAEDSDNDNSHEDSGSDRKV